MQSPSFSRYNEMDISILYFQVFTIVVVSTIFTKPVAFIFCYKYDKYFITGFQMPTARNVQLVCQSVLVRHTKVVESTAPLLWT